MHKPRKRFGQHFLSDEHIVARIIAALHPLPTQTIVEIGPGHGALTWPLLDAGYTLDVVELDRDLIPPLQAHAHKTGKLTVYEADALTFDFTRLKKHSSLLRIIGNLPYNISTPLLFHLLEFAACIDDMLFMLQKEVAQRIAANPGSKTYGRLSVMVQYHCQVELLFDVPPSAFSPPPKVQSSMVKLMPYQKLPFQAKDLNVFATIVRLAFSMRRKTVRNSLKKMIDEKRLTHLGIDANLRPENLTVKNFVDISNEVVT